MTERELYPEMVGVGLSAVLQIELDKLGTGLRASWFEPLAHWSGVERASRRAQVAAAQDERAFNLSLWADGVEHLAGRTSDLATIAAAIRDWLDDEQPGSDTLVAQFPFLEQRSLGRAYERGEAREHLWQALLEHPPTESLDPLIEAAAAEPSLRRLYPATSLDRLYFSYSADRVPGADLPYCAPRDGVFRVYAPTREYLSENPKSLLGSGNARRAVELLIDALPD